VLILLAGLSLVACPDGSGRASRKAPADTLTTRQRDSVLGETPIPGASGVRKALEIQDSARARNARIDSIGGS
jgi:hypothetical protein